MEAPAIRRAAPVAALVLLVSMVAPAAGQALTAGPAQPTPAAPGTQAGPAQPTPAAGGTQGHPGQPLGDLLAPPSASAHLTDRPTYAECIRPDKETEIYGPTRINAQSGNQGLSVGVDSEATVTVLRWPRPSFHDQVKYHTRNRDDPRFGADANAGIFLGLVLETSSGTDVTWLREMDATQRYLNDASGDVAWSDTVVTWFEDLDRGVNVTVRDTVAPDADVLGRQVSVTLLPESTVEDARLLAFENLNLVASKWPYFPTQGWCQEAENADRARYRSGSDAIVHTKTSFDKSTQSARSVALALGFGDASTGHQVGGDAWIPTGTPAAAFPTRVQDAYLDARDGQLRGNDDFVGQTTGALATDLDVAEDETTGDPAARADAATLYLAAGRDAADALANLTHGRNQGPEDIREAKQAWFAGLLDDAPLPDTDDPVVEALARRALVTMVTDYDPESGAVVAGIATQGPKGVDWIRDGAYFNHALDLVGLEDWTRKRMAFYADLQQKATDPEPFQPTTPPGNWFMAYYGDGTPAGYNSYEIDETGYGAWIPWDHYRNTGNKQVLEEFYPMTRRAADHLVHCTDPTTGLQCLAHEDDAPTPSQTIAGASLAWLGLDAAAKAADVLGETEDHQRYADRRAELGAAIDTYLWNEDADGYGTASESGRQRFRLYGGGGGNQTGWPEVGWPVCFKPYDAPRLQGHFASIWDSIAPSFAEPQAGQRQSGLYESKGLIALGKAWKGHPAKMAQVRSGLEWVAEKHATPDTHVMGETWMLRDGEVITGFGQPHAWEQILFYLASLEAYPLTGLHGQGPATCGGNLGLLHGG